MDDDDDIDFIPIKNLPNSGLKAFNWNTNYEELDPEQQTFANNVLIGALDKLKNVSIVGQNADGEFYFASSLEDGEVIQHHLKKFYNLIERQ